MSTPTDPAIDAIRDQFLSSFPEEAPAETAPAEVVAPPPAPTAEVGTVEATPAPEQPVEAAAEPEARAYRRLLTREAKLREEQKALEADKAAVAALKAAQAKLSADPIGYLKAAGLSQAQILEALKEAQVADLGDLAPAEARIQLAAKRAERLNLETQEKLAAQAEAAQKALQEREAQAEIAKYQAGISEFVTTGLTEFPHLATVAAAGRPVAQAIWQTAVEMATANPHGPAPTYAQAAAQLNSQLMELASVVAPAAKPTEPLPATPPATASKPVLRNSSTQAQPSAAPEPTGLSYNQLREQIRSKVLQKYGYEG
jgi:O6-methylguanine-DNA--protein-cysteine methyltransferase